MDKTERALMEDIKTTMRDRDPSQRDNKIIQYNSQLSSLRNKIEHLNGSASALEPLPILTSDQVKILTQSAYMLRRTAEDLGMMEDLEVERQIPLKETAPPTGLKRSSPSFNQDEEQSRDKRRKLLEGRRSDQDYGR